MKKLISLLLVLTCLQGFAQYDTVGIWQPVPPQAYTPMTARGYQFKSIKIDSSLWVLRNARFNDSVMFRGPVYGIPFGSQDGWIQTPTVSWVSGLTFDIGPGSWRLNGILYTKLTTTQLTLSAADPTNPREDLLVGNTSGAVVAITGTPSTPPVAPVPDVSTQLALAIIGVAAGATTPTGVTNTLVYDENVEWTTSSNMTGANATYAVNPFSGAVSHRVTGFSTGTYLKYLNSSVLNTSSFNLIKFYVRLNANMAAGSNLMVIFYRGSSPVSNTVVFTNPAHAFVKTNTTGYQTVTMNLSEFTFFQNTFDNVQIMSAGGTSSGFQVDFINLQTGVTVISNNGVTSFNGRTGAVFPLTGDYIVESATVAALPTVGQTGKLYLITSGGDINKSYRWTGSAYALVGDGSGGGSTNTNLGAGYRWAVPNTNGIKTAFYGYGLLADSTTNANGITAKVDTATLFGDLPDLVLGGDYLFAPTPNSIAVDSNQIWIATATLTNKRWTARVGSTTSSATPTINTDNYDIYKLTAQTEDITSFTTNLSGTPVDGDILEIQITGTAARLITWGASFVSSTVTLPTTTTTTATLTVILQYYTTSSYGNNKWVCVNYY